MYSTARVFPFARRRCTTGTVSLSFLRRRDGALRDAFADPFSPSATDGICMTCPQSNALTCSAWAAYTWCVSRSPSPIRRSFGTDQTPIRSEPGFTLYGSHCLKTSTFSNGPYSLMKREYYALTSYSCCNSELTTFALPFTRHGHWRSNLPRGSKLRL